MQRPSRSFWVRSMPSRPARYLQTLRRSGRAGLLPRMTRNKQYRQERGATPVPAKCMPAASRSSRARPSNLETATVKSQPSNRLCPRPQTCTKPCGTNLPLRKLLTASHSRRHRTLKSLNASSSKSKRSSRWLRFPSSAPTSSEACPYRSLETRRYLCSLVLDSLGRCNHTRRLCKI